MPIFILLCLFGKTCTDVLRPSGVLLVFFLNKVFIKTDLGLVFDQGKMRSTYKSCHVHSFILKSTYSIKVTVEVQSHYV